jgi:hypothetical protein
MPLPDDQLNNQPFDPFRNPKYHRIKSKSSSKQTDGLETFEHLLLLKTSRPAIILHPDSVMPLSTSFHDPILHLSGQVIKPIVRRIHKFKFILHVSFIIFLNKILYKLLFFFLGASKLIEL